MPAARTVRSGDVLTFDVVIVGAGVAGLVAALDLLERRASLAIAVVDKGAVGSSGSTPLAQGGMAAAVGPGDSPALHAADTVRAGDGLCDPEAVAVLTSEGPARVRDLIARGARFDRGDDARLSLAREGGQSVPRSVRAADASGAEIFRALRTAATGRVTRLQGIAARLATAPQPGNRDRATGVWAVLDPVERSPLGPAQDGGLVLVRAGAVLLASGGCGGLYAATTNRDGATADGVALAHAAGAALVDLEFVQFHPTGLRPAARAGGYWRLLLTEALRGAGAVLVGADGRRFLPDRHPDAELAPRHVVTKAILDQPSGAWLDATALGSDVLGREFPTVLAGARRYGYDLAREPVPVEPCQHYQIGGVVTDLWGRTTVPGLYAAGEVACTGVHGANRMAGNSLLQSCVFAHRAARVLGDEALAPPAAEPAAPAVVADGSGDPDAARATLRHAMSEGAGAIRSTRSLTALGDVLDGLTSALPDALTAPPAAGPAPIAGDRAGIELVHALTVARLLARSALLRRESRGTHWRDDHPSRDPLWSGVRLRVQDCADTSRSGTTRRETDAARVPGNAGPLA